MVGEVGAAHDDKVAVEDGGDGALHVRGADL